MEKLSAKLVLCEEDLPVTFGAPHKGPAVEKAVDLPVIW